MEVEVYVFIVDRIEGNFVVVEFNDTMIEVPLELFKEEVKEGDVLYLSVDKDETEKRHNELKGRLFSLFQRDK